MRIDAHTHGMHAERDAHGRPRPPLMAGWRAEHGSPDSVIQTLRSQGIEKVLLLDPADIAFEIQRIFGDFVVPIPRVHMDKGSPEEIHRLLSQGVRGIKFIAPMHSYGDRRYFPLYEAVLEHKALAVFHTGFLMVGGIWAPGSLMEVEDFVDITHMRPAAIDRVARAFPDLKILMSHFGNPWWEECWTVIASHGNVYADFSGGTAFTKSMAMWKEMFAPNGRLHVASVSKLCFASDSAPTFPDPGHDIYATNYAEIVDFYERLYETLSVPAELRRRIERENIAGLLST